MCYIRNRNNRRSTKWLCKGRSYTDEYFSLKLVEKVREFNLQTHVVFIDYKKAFDRDNRKIIFDILQNIHVTNQLLKAVGLHNIYKRNWVALKVGRVCSGFQ
jgi:reverse gyrase